MKIRQLLEAPAPDEVKQQMAKWRDLAASPYELTIDGSGKNASSGFPLTRKAGTWYGGLLLPRGGFKKEADRLVSLSARTKGFLKALGKSLEQLSEQGHEIRVTGDFGLASSPLLFDRIKRSSPGSIADDLLSRVTTEDLLRIGHPAQRIFWHVTALPVKEAPNK